MYLELQQVKLIFKYHEIYSKITEPDKKLRKKIQFSSKFAKRKVAKITITGDQIERRRKDDLLNRGNNKRDSRQEVDLGFYLSKLNI